MRKLQRTALKGFTLIELMIPIAIIGIGTVGVGVVGFLCYAAGKAAGIF